MGRFRSLLTRFIKPAAMVGTVGILSFGLVVTTPSNAHALVTYPKIPPAATFIVGATKTVAPAAMAVASFTPVGLGLRLAFLAFSTADLWVPLVTEAFGNPSNKVPSGATSTTIPGFTLAPDPLTVTQGAYAAPNSGYTATVTNTTSTANDVLVAKQIQCKVNATGQEIGRYSTQGMRLNPGMQMIVNGSCDRYETMVGASVSPECSLQACAAGVVGRPGPETVATYGTLRPSGFDPRSPEVGYQGRSECIDSMGNISWAEGPITPGNNDGGTMLMPSCEKAGKGHGTGRTQVKGFKPDGSTEIVWDTGAKPLTDPSTPLCDPGRAGSGCVMEITKDGKPCTTGDVECENWPSEAPKDGTGTRWKCKFGPYVLPLSACGLLEQAYVPGGAPLNEPNTDGSPDTRSPLGPDGQPAAPAAPTVTGTVPGSPTPGAPGAPGPGSDTSSRQCWPTGWGMFNPLEWVLKPLRCAFEPTKNIAAEGGALRDKALTKAPLSFVAAISATAPASVGGQGACPAWVVHISSSGGGVDGAYSKNVVCESSFIQSIVNARPVLFGLISGAMLWPFLRSLWYAIIPIVRVVPTGGK